MSVYRKRRRRGRRAEPAGSWLWPVCNGLPGRPVIDLDLVIPAFALTPAPTPLSEPAQPTSAVIDKLWGFF